MHKKNDFYKPCQRSTSTFFLFDLNQRFFWTTGAKVRGQKVIKGLLIYISPCLYSVQSYMYIPSTLNTDYLLWHTQLIVCAVKY